MDLWPNVCHKKDRCRYFAAVAPWSQIYPGLGAQIPLPARLTYERKNYPAALQVLGVSGILLPLAVKSFWSRSNSLHLHRTMKHLPRTPLPISSEVARIQVRQSRHPRKRGSTGSATARRSSLTIMKVRRRAGLLLSASLVLQSSAQVSKWLLSKRYSPHL